VNTTTCRSSSPAVPSRRVIGPGRRLLGTVVAVAALLVGTVQGPVSAEPTPLVERVTIGAYVHLQGQPFRDPVAPEHLAQIESQVGRLDLVHYFFTWGRRFDEAVSPNLDGRKLMLSMKPDGDLVGRIAAGQENAYIDRFARDVRGHGKPVFIRFGHEMNGEWMSYSAGRPGGPAAAQFVRAWRHLVRRFRAAGATNARFVWSPNEKDFPARDGNRMEDYWPGQAYVDVAGFDGYDWSTAEPRRGDGQDRTFEQVVQGPYDRISRLTTRPIWLCEFGTTDPGKGQWFRDMFASTRFPRLTGIVYFSEHDERDVQRDWRIDSSAGSIAGWRDGVAARSASSSRPD
jgi:hypothetical protein